MRRATIRQIVTIHRSDYGVRQIQMTHCFRNMTRLFGIESARLALTDRAESAVARADVAREHEGSGSVGPALEDVRTLGLLADSVQVQAFYKPENVVLIRRVAQTNLQPLRLRLARACARDVDDSQFAAQSLLLRKILMRLF